MTPGRLKGVSLIAVALLAAATLLAWSQPWFTVTLDGARLEVGGDVAAAALAPLALAGLALVAALALAGPFFRAVLGILAALLGVAVVAVSLFVLSEPALAVAPAVSEATGVTGLDSIARRVEAATPSAWPFVAVGVGSAEVAAGVVIALSGRRWPASGRRYGANRLAPADGTPDAIAEWDALSAGDDPTAGTDPGNRDR